jgi:hypothetical protein
MLQAPAEAIKRRMPDARKTALNTRTGTEMLKTLFCGLEGTKRIVNFLFVRMEGPLYLSK